MNEPILTVIVPCYNEEEVLPYTMKRLNEIVHEMIDDGMISQNSKILFVDDGSKDQTWSIIYKESLKNELVRGLKLSRNAGHQNALLAGLMAAKNESDCLITIDADLQDDVQVMKEFIEKYHEGYEIVYGVRNKRSTDSIFKRNSAQLFYKIMSYIGVKLIYNHADYRLMSRRAVEELDRFQESNLFLRGIVPLLGFKSTSVYYERKERKAGQTKYPLKKMISFALDGVTSFSVFPLRIIMFVGFLLILLSLLSGMFHLIFTDGTWNPLVMSIWIMGGIQLIALGVVGEYIGRVYMEVKNRPKYIVDIDTFNMPFLGKKSNMHQTEKLLEKLRK